MAGVIITDTASRVAELRERISRACAKSDPPRNQASVLLLAVCKRQPTDRIRAAYQSGVRDFGENYVQQIASRVEELPDMTGISWHLIGNLQKNKAKQAARLCAWAHALDKFKTAQALGRARTEAGMKPISACIQVNISSEATKSGISVDEAPDLVEEVSRIEGIRLRGLMCIPEAGLDTADMRARFAQLSELQTSMQGRSLYTLDTLSMGMSADFESAIEEGATIVRVGTALFGERS